jgi:sodium-coupled monocarboxylate transporter 8/12
VVVATSVFLGLTIYARYAGCDPLTSQKISKNDEIVAYYIMEIAENIPCLSGLFMAAIVSAAIRWTFKHFSFLDRYSLFSFQYHFVDIKVIYKDFISKFSRRQLSEKSAIFILKLIIVIEGVVSTSLVLLIEHLREIIPLSTRLSGMVRGPLVGLFTLGVLFPKINAKVLVTLQIDNNFSVHFRAHSMDLFVD